MADKINIMGIPFDADLTLQRLLPAGKLTINIPRKPKGAIILSFGSEKVPRLQLNTYVSTFLTMKKLTGKLWRKKGYKLSKGSFYAPEGMPLDKTKKEILDTYREAVALVKAEFKKRKGKGIKAADGLRERVTKKMRRANTVEGMLARIEKRSNVKKVTRSKDGKKITIELAAGSFLDEAV